MVFECQPLPGCGLGA
ncbi:hypothetical protein MTR67_022653 [Solanum verrucosum]|uniref:Uncharacterized protein n=1 Tax=Solanum verrucosum TaxID=315347 RepID=A0AAF0QVQ5_SOLVR|nr:hypothetical protein MTR67_022653 [Solanum verrucosum]